MDILIGNVHRAPAWMQRSGLEWLGRCVQEPTRLLPRYARNFGGLALRLPLALLADFVQRPYRGLSAINRTSDAGMVHLHIQGNLEAETAGAIHRTVTNCVSSGQLLVVHLNDLEYASAEGLGALLDARRRMLATGLSLTMASVPAKIKLLFAAWCLEPLFDEFALEHEPFAQRKSARRAEGFRALIDKEAGLTAKSES